MGKRIITIDGPAGAGKTTVSRRLSEKLGCIYVDTGALYRGVALELKLQGVNWENDADLADFLSRLDLNFIRKSNQLVLMSSGKDITDFIRTQEISMLASACSARTMIRESLLDIQRNIARLTNAVFEGRDMGTIVFPQAAFKFYLFADLNVRARRRYNESQDPAEDIKKVEQLIELRDKNDSQRKTAPLKPAKDAIKIDSSLLTIEQVVDKMVKIIEKD